MALNHVKAAFCLKIAKQLTEKFKLQSRGNVDSVEVIQDGFHFRLTLLVRKELALLKELSHKKSEVLPMEMAFLLPKLNTALHTLYLDHTAYGPAVLIAKRWFYSQLLDPFLWPDICTELLMAYVFLVNKSFDPPQQPQMAFLRFLELLRSTNWASHLFILNFSDELNGECVKFDRSRIKKQLLVSLRLTNHGNGKQFQIGQEFVSTAGDNHVVRYEEKFHVVEGRAEHRDSAARRHFVEFNSSTVRREYFQRCLPNEGNERAAH